MSDSIHTFALSQDFLARSRRDEAVAIWWLVLTLAVMAPVVADFEFRAAEFYTVLVIVLAVGTAVAILSALTRRTSNEAHLKVGPNGLQQEVSGATRAVSWDTINRVLIRVNPRGEPYLVQIFPVRGPPLQLIGFAPMGDIVALIHNYVSPTVHVLAVQERVSREHPLFLPMVLIAATIIALAAMFAMRRWDLSGDAIVPIVALAAGVVIIRYGPLSRTQPSMRNHELIVGGLIVFSAIVIIVLRVLPLLRGS